jgi:PKD repeat protein
MPDTSGITGGVAVSPNSRFLYVIARETIYQYDFWASDFLASREIVAEYDGFVSFFPTKFNLAQLGPDGKIYINTLTTDNYLHVINHPNRKGMDCEVLQHSIKLPTLNDRSIPNFPNYRLGPIDESTCDTLGIDNLPLANYTYEKDSINTLSVSFTDNSFYEPIDWFWDFDNGKMSNEVNPIHEFEEEGFYNVCLTVSNQYDSDTFCREIELMTTSIKEIEKNEKHFELYPNPAQNLVTAKLPKELSVKGQLIMFNTTGTEVLRIEIPSETISIDIDVQHLSNGVYTCSVIEDNKEIYTKRLVITK